MRVITLLSACSIAAGSPSLVSAQRADLVLVNGKVVTVDSQRPRAEAVAVRGDRLIAVGTSTEIWRLAGPGTRVIDLRGRLLVPGFVESHGHFLSLGESKLVLDLRDATSWEDIVSLVSEAVRRARPGEWIVGRGWQQERWRRAPVPNVQGVPLHSSLDRVSPDNPVVLSHVSGHGSFANARALALAGITRETRDPEGGEIVRDESGAPTGFLKEAAQRPVSAARERAEQASPEEREARFRTLVRLAGEEALRYGVTSFHDAGTSLENIDAFRRLADDGTLPVRLYVMIRGGEGNARLDSLLPRYRMIGYGKGFLTVRAIKRVIDGALGVRGAWLLEPYADLPESRGLMMESPDVLEETARIAARHGFQLGTHAIGDRATREVLDMYERTFRRAAGVRDLRWRVEHASMVDPADVQRFRALGVIASMQGSFIASGGDWVRKRLGAERAARTIYPWQSLLRAGAIIASGTDVPVDGIDPIASFRAIVTRRTHDGSVFLPEQRVAREAALRAHTLNGAYAAFEEADKGSITVGKLADLVVLTKDILTIPEDELATARVALTMVGGKVAYHAP